MPPPLTKAITEIFILRASSIERVVGAVLLTIMGIPILADPMSISEEILPVLMNQRD